MGKGRGPAGESKPPPRQPTPTPRGFKILLSQHARKRCEERGVDINHVMETIVHGREITSLEPVKDGFQKSEFRKTFVIRDSGSPISKNVVAVCAVSDEQCIVLTAYHGQG